MKTGTAIACFSQCNSVCLSVHLSVCPTLVDQSKIVQARITKSHYQLLGRV